MEKTVIFLSLMQRFIRVKMCFLQNQRRNCEMWCIEDIRVAHLIDKELELKNSGAALVLTVGVHPRPSQSDGVPKVKEAHRTTHLGQDLQQKGSD